ncbi:cytochrome b5-like heme/Steroid binding domain-containing protein [Sarocladium implicatum]|nr:cytochrome b5-like heme/Steroid binding domain-containing protein [Sarocladium implicatum]
MICRWMRRNYMLDASQDSIWPNHIPALGNFTTCHWQKLSIRQPTIRPPCGPLSQRVGHGAPVRSQALCNGVPAVPVGKGPLGAKLLLRVPQCSTIANLPRLSSSSSFTLPTTNLHDLLSITGSAPQPKPSTRRFQTSQPNPVIMSETKEYTYQDVAEHNTKKDFFLVIHDKVYDCGKFVDDGGEEVMLDVAGQDATEAFEDVGHSDEARETLDRLLVGTLKRQVSPATRPPTRLPTPPTPRTRPTSPVSASVSTPSFSSVVPSPTVPTSTCSPSVGASSSSASEQQVYDVFCSGGDLGAASRLRAGDCRSKFSYEDIEEKWFNGKIKGVSGAPSSDGFLLSTRREIDGWFGLDGAGSTIVCAAGCLVAVRFWSCTMERKGWMTGFFAP